MASDRSPLSKRLKSLTQRAGRPGEESREASPANDTPVEPDAVGDDEQPTGDVPMIEEPAAAIVPPARSQDAEPPTLVPERPAEPAEPITPRSTVWPQTTPTPRFDPPATTSSADPTFPAPSPAPIDRDVAAPADDATQAASEGGAAPEGKSTVFAGLRRRRDEPAPAPLDELPAKPSFTERAALRRRAKSLRARRDSGLLELGAIVLDQRRFGDPTGGSLTRRRTDELADMDRELAAIEQVLDDDGPAETVAQLGVVRCRGCSSLVGPGDRFCASCGAPRPESADAGANGSG